MKLPLTCLSEKMTQTRVYKSHVFILSAHVFGRAKGKTFFFVPHSLIQTQTNEYNQSQNNTLQRVLAFHISQPLIRFNPASNVQSTDVFVISSTT